MQIRLTTPLKLKAQELALWDRTQRSMQEFESPYFRPEFTQAVAAVRDDVEVALLHDDEEVLGFFPFQRGTMNLGRPVAGKLNDFHGVVAPPGVEVDATQLIDACNLSSYDFDHFVGNQPSFTSRCSSTESSTYLDLSQGYGAYCEAIKSTGSEIIRKTISRERKFAREVGELRFDLHTIREDVLKTLIQWKVKQFERTGFMNLFAFPWTEALLRHILSQSKPGLSALLSVLWAGEKPIAIAYSLRSFSVGHAWFIAYDQQYATYSPGTIMMLKLAEQGAAAGLKRLHLGAGDQRFKQSLANGAIEVGIGSVERAGMATALRRAWRWTRDTVAAANVPSYLRLPTWCLRPVRSWIAFR